MASAVDRAGAAEDGSRRPVSADDGGAAPRAGGTRGEPRRCAWLERNDSLFIMGEIRRPSPSGPWSTKMDDYYWKQKTSILVSQNPRNLYLLKAPPPPPTPLHCSPTPLHHTATRCSFRIRREPQRRFRRRRRRPRTSRKDERAALHVRQEVDVAAGPTIPRRRPPPPEPSPYRGSLAFCPSTTRAILPPRAPHRRLVVIVVVQRFRFLPRDLRARSVARRRPSARRRRRRTPGAADALLHPPRDVPQDALHVVARRRG